MVSGGNIDGKKRDFKYFLAKYAQVTSFVIFVQFILPKTFWCSMIGFVETAVKVNRVVKS